MTNIHDHTPAPCPFCGSKNIKSVVDVGVRLSLCYDCGAQGPNEYGSVTWNTRHPDLLRERDELKRANAELREALVDMVFQACEFDGVLRHTFISTYEGAFELLGLENGMTLEEAREALKQHEATK